ncbi:MAG TPA: hypothetical protein VFN52_06285, partial [Acidiferrobacteraceae bacterium]|nr:hypothetical protein [Acidiferrobacteraceae bacterium]
GDALYRRVAEETGNWLIREMRSPEGGFYATLDADSEGHEGAYYVFSQKQLEQATGVPERAVARICYGFDRPPNFEGRWHLVQARTIPEAVATLQRDPALVTQQLEAARTALRAQRATRVRPGRDEKILVSWNGLAIQGLARAGQQLAVPAFVDAATSALDFVRRELWHEGHLFAVYKGGRRPLNAYLDDYAFLLAAILELLQVRWRDEDIVFAGALADRLLDHFEDQAHGGFFFTSDDHETLLYRPKPLGDDATPSGNAIAARALIALGHLLGHATYLERADRALRAAAHNMERYPSAHASLVLALQALQSPPDLILVRGPAAALAALAAGPLQAKKLRFLIPDEAQELPGNLRHLQSSGGVTAWVCRGLQCEAPTQDPARIHALLHEPTSFRSMST